MKRLAETPVIVLLGIIASCISVFAFFTDINSIYDFFTPNETVLSAKYQTPVSNVALAPQLPTGTMSPDWSGVLEARKPTLNEIRAEVPVSIWIENNIEVRDMRAPGTDQYPGTAAVGREYLLPVYWCASSADQLQQNMDNIETIFMVNGEVVPEKYIFNYNYDANDEWKCSYHAVVFSGWDRSQQYTLQARRILKVDLSDGQSSYQAGTYVFGLVISVKE